MPTDDIDATAALFSALRRFPDRAQDIKSLMGRDEEFLEMCEELAEADRALANLATVPAAERHARAEEWSVWIARLTEEIAEALERSNVIPMGSHNRPR
jgi:hypothetical protein